MMYPAIVPSTVLAGALNLADDVPCDRAINSLSDCTTLWPSGQVVEVECHVERLCPAIQVHAIEVEQVLDQHWPERDHGLPSAAAARPANEGQRRRPSDKRAHGGQRPHGERCVGADELS